MPPIVALIICTIFVLWLLRLERKQSPDVSLALWIPTIWLLVIFSKPLAIWFSTSGVDMEAGSPLDRTFLIGIACISLIIIAKRHCSWANLIKDNIWAALLILYMLISISWSEMPFVSLKRWVRELVAIIMVFSVATERDPHQALQCLFRRLIYVLMPFSLILIKFYPHLGVDYAHWSGMQMWTGVALHKNSLSMLCLLSIFYLIWTLIRRWQGSDIPVIWYQKYVEAYLLFLSIWLFMGPYHTVNNSATSTASLAVGLTALIGFLWMQKLGKIISANTLTLIIVSIIVYGTITPFVGGLSLVDVSSTFGRDDTLTGRSDVWRILVPYALNKAFLGHGFGGFWTDAMRNIAASHAHNGYLDVILDLGFIGLVLFSVFLFKNCRNAQREMTKNFDFGLLWFCILLMSVIQDIAESSMTSLASHNAAILMLFNITIASSSNNKKVF